MDKTKIEWCDSTWNPVTGCNHNCGYCYARGIATRFGGKALNIPHELNAPFFIAGEKSSRILLMTHFFCWYPLPLLRFCLERESFRGLSTVT